MNEFEKVMSFVAGQVSVQMDQQIAASQAIHRELHTMQTAMRVRGHISTLLLGVLIGVILSVAITVIFGTTATLFEDGSVQFFNKAGWGFCLFPYWGCS